MFHNRKLLIATKHHKEKVIAPMFEKSLNVSCYVTDLFDTDCLGTFSGEIPRVDDALTTLRNKCLLAMEKNHSDLVVASEGSFGAHPSVFFAAADDELMMLIDAKHDLEIVAREISMDTNFNASHVENESDLLDFAKRVKFPSHGIILKPSEKSHYRIIKGSSSFFSLKKHFREIKKEYGTVYVETDMRAHYNPTRMKVIEKTAAKLLKAIKSKCNKCDTPGFTVTQALPGLPCQWCKTPTASTLCFIYTCKKCGFTKEELYPHKKATEDPAYCNSCNP